MNDDLALIAGKFMDNYLDKSKRYLLQYFENQEPQLKFLSYYFCLTGVVERSGVRLIQNFGEHTGIVACRRVIQKWTQRVKLLELLVKQAQEESDLELLSRIKNGELPRSSIHVDLRLLRFKMTRED